MKRIVEKLRKLNKTISTMESCTGGGVANVITNIEGASEILKFSAVTYSNEFKIKMGVDKNIIDILNLDNENFEKIFLIFSDKNTILNDVSFNASVNALLQRKFRIKVPEIVLIFPTALHAIETGDIKELGEMIDLLTEVLSEDALIEEAPMEISDPLLKTAEEMDFETFLKNLNAAGKSADVTAESTTDNAN